MNDGPQPSTVEGAVDETPPAKSDVADQVGRAVRDELDEVVPHLVAALKRDRAFETLAERLATAERRLDARRERPVAVELLRLLHRLRRLEFDAEVRASLDAELVEILKRAGYVETGRAGDDFDPARHEALDGRAEDQPTVVVEVYATGMESYGDVVVRAKVRVGPADADSRP